VSVRDSYRALILSTLAFAVAFAVWGMIAPMAKTFQTQFHLSESQAWALIAVPVLLGSVGRLPAGMLTDRFGGRVVFTVLLLGSALAALLLSFATSYTALLVGGFCVGLAGTSFSVGVGLVSRWFPPARQGFALGVYGAGTGGQTLALMGVPFLAKSMGWPGTYRVFAAVAAVAAVVFYLLARDAPVERQAKGVGEMLRVFREQPLSWLLGLFYFVTFGGFVALSIGLPKLLQELFHLTREDAGLRVAGFVLVAIIMRPIGGVLSDRIGGAKVLTWVFAGAAVLAWGMTFSDIVPFTIGALGVAFCIGLGNGAVFKLVPQYFPKETGTVTGLVGALGGLGGFFPPLLLGAIKTATGSYGLGFILLSLFCVGCFALNQKVFLSRPRGPLRAAAAGAE
jgi:NNP family nitrate/nitrite transporter-like MFS transporter